MYLPCNRRRSRCPWHLNPWHPRFCVKDGQCFPPFSGGVRIVRVRVIIPDPHATSHSLQTPHSLTVQSITENVKLKTNFKLESITNPFIDRNEPKVSAKKAQFHENNFQMNTKKVSFCTNKSNERDRKKSWRDKYLNVEGTKKNLSSISLLEQDLRQPNYGHN